MFVCTYVFRSDEVSKRRNGRRLGGFSEADRLTISEVVEVLRDPSKFPVITDPPQRPKAVPNLHSSCCSANFHFIPQVILFLGKSVAVLMQYSRSRLLISATNFTVVGQTFDWAAGSFLLCLCFLSFACM